MSHDLVNHQNVNRILKPVNENATLVYGGGQDVLEQSKQGLLISENPSNPNSSRSKVLKSQDLLVKHSKSKPVMGKSQRPLASRGLSSDGELTINRSLN